jgi:enterochelin esterase-like enzyme
MSEQPLESPRLTSLQHDLQAGNGAALQEFWSEVEARGTPLIEPTDDDDGYMWVTFLWRAHEPVESVAVLICIDSWRHLLAGPGSMQQLGDTDLWFKTYRMRRDMRTDYKLGPNDSLLPYEKEQDWPTRTTKWQIDPLNPRRSHIIADPEWPDSEDWLDSVLELPGAPPQPWLERRPGVAEGKLTIDQLHSSILGNDHRVAVYTPTGYSSEADPYPLLLFFDAYAHYNWLSIDRTLDNLIAARQIPPTVAVLVDSPSLAARNAELFFQDRTVEFMAQELLPWAQSNYHLSADPARRLIGGLSLGGVAAAFTALRRPDLFGNVLSQSGAFFLKPEGEQEPEWLARQYAASEKLSLRWYLNAGLYERWQDPDQGSDMLVSNRHFRDVLVAKGYPVQFVEFAGGHDLLWWRGLLADGLVWLLGQT